VSGRGFGSSVMRRCWVSSLNNPALNLLVFLSVIWAPAMVAVPRITGVSQGMRSEALYKGYLWFPDPVEGFLFVLASGGHRGGGYGVEERSRLKIRRLGRCSSPLAVMDELRRLLNPLGSGEWQPVSTSPGYSLAEGRPGASADYRRRSLSFLPAWSLLGRQLGILYLESTISATGFRGNRRRCGGDPSIPSGVVPGDGGIASEQEMHFGPNCDFGSRSRVLSASIRDLLVIFLFVESCGELCTVYEF
jgi:hypothetical protein